jgi:hypothetical protein
MQNARLMHLKKWRQDVLCCRQHGERSTKGAKMNAVAELEKLKKPKVFKGMSEVAVKVEQRTDEMGHAPEHEPFTDERKNVRVEKCALCGAEYFLAFSPIYRTTKTFEELSDELQTRLEEDHRMNRNHSPLVPLRRSDHTRRAGRIYPSRSRSRYTIKSEPVLSGPPVGKTGAGYRWAVREGGVVREDGQTIAAFSTEQEAMAFRDRRSADEDDAPDKG